MKKLTYILLLLTFSTLKAQYTLIPDSNFESELVAQGYDDVVNGLVLTTNIENITYFGAGWAFIYDLTGIQDFTALETLSIPNNKLTTIDLSQNTNLVYLNIERNHLESLDLTGNPNLEYINCGFQQDLDDFYLTSLNVSQCYSLIHLNANNNPLITSLNVSNSPNLEYLKIRSRGITNLDLTNNPNLELLDVYGIKVNNLDLSQNILLKDLDLSATENLDMIDLSNNINLEIFKLNYPSDNLTSLDLTHNINLKYFRYSQYQNPPLSVQSIEEIDFSQNIALEHLKLYQSSVINVDLSNCPNLIEVDLSGMYQIASVNLKNGFNELLEDVHISQYPTTPDLLTCVEVDDAYYSSNTTHWTIPYYFSYSEDCSALSITDNDFEQDISIFPNPTSEYISIDNHNKLISNVNIYNQLGTLVVETKKTKFIDVSHLEKGVYFIKIKILNNSILKQFIKS